MKGRLFLLLIITCVCAGLRAQSVDPTDPVLVNAMSAIRSVQGLQYNATMRFQEFGSDTFSVRHFTVAFQNNPGAVFGYDWAVEEERGIGRVNLMFLPGSLFTIIKGQKRIVHRSLETPLQGSDYYEMLRLELIPGELIGHFMAHRSHDTADSSGVIMVEVQPRQWARRQLFIDAGSWLPVRSVSLITDPDFGLTQTQVIEFSYPVTQGVVADSILSPQYFLDAGYDFSEVVVEAEAEEELLSISDENAGMLLAYPFLSAGDDEVRLDTVGSPYILIDFWYASCIPCLRAMPELQRIADEFAPDLSVYAINCFDSGIRANLTQRLHEKGIKLPLLFSENELVRKLGISTYPTYLLVDPEGRVRVLNGGIAEIRHTLEELIRD